MSRLLLFLLLLGFSFHTSLAQTVQWASEVIEFSSELTPIQYSASQALGKPDVLPAGRESASAWTPNRANKSEFLKLGFKEAMKVRQIAVGESYNPSALNKIFLYDESGNEHLVNEFPGGPVPQKGRLLNVFIEETAYMVKAIKLEFDGSLVPEYYSIDAVGISDSEELIVAEVAIPDDLITDLVVESLGDNVNSEFREYNPILSPDGKVLYFSRKHHPDNIGGEDDQEDIWFSEMDENGEWLPAKNIGETLNNDQPNFVSSVTPDGNTVVLILGNRYLENGKMIAGVSVSTKVNDTWSIPQPIEIENDYNFNKRANYFMTNNRKVLLLSVEREDTHGDRDLYVSFLMDDDTWSEPKNLGPQVNTASEESAPFLAADDITLFFSSTGFSGYGGADIYVSKRLDDTWTNWSEPQNMGPQINTENDDLFFSIPADSQFAFYSRGVSLDDNDIYTVEMPLFSRPIPVIAIKGRIINAETGEPVDAKIIYERLSDGAELGIAQANPNTGEFEFILPSGELYGFRAEADGYVSVNENIDLRDYKGDDYTIQLRDLKLVPIKEKVVVVLNNVFFDFDKAILKQESFPELKRVAELLKERPSLQIEISGHTCNVGPAAYNLNLSKRRAEAVAKYVKDQDIDDSRIMVKFFGEEQPSETNETIEGRQKNRRVEFEIIRD